MEPAGVLGAAIRRREISKSFLSLFSLFSLLLFAVLLHHLESKNFELLLKMHKNSRREKDVLFFGKERRTADPCVCLTRCEF